MRGFWVYAAATAVTMVIGSAARAGLGDEFIEILIEGGVIEISVTIDPPDGPPSSQSMQFPVGDSGAQEFYSFGDAEAEGNGYFEAFVNESNGSSTLDLFAELGAEQSDFGYEVTVRMRTIVPIVFRILDWVESNGSGSGDFDLDPVSGSFDGGRMCPGTYAISFDETLELDSFNNNAFLGGGLQLQLNDPFDLDVRFTGVGDLNVSGNAQDDQGNKDSAFAQGTIDDSAFATSGCTSSGLVDGDAMASGEISNQSNGSYNVTVIADALATQPVGYGGSCFIGAFGNAIILDLEKPKVFTIVSSGSSPVALTPTTGSIVGDTLSPGRYAINFNTSATIEAGQTMASGSIDWTLQLRTPGCSGADLASPSGVLDFSDVIAFLGAYGASEPAADLAPPIGVWDFTDVLAFIGIFAAGCP